MMAYCTFEDVESLMGQHFSTATRPSVSEVTDAVDTVAAELDGIAQAAGYTVPIISASAVSLMKRYNIFGAAVSAWHTGIVGNDEPARVVYWKEQYAAFITRLQSGEQQLPGATPAGAPGEAFSAPTSRVDGYSAARRGVYQPYHPYGLED
jgi:hypothetical protein